MHYTPKRAIEIFRQEGTLAFTKRSSYFILKYILDFVRTPYCLFKIRNYNQNYDLNEIVDFVFTACYGLIRPLQIRDEILKLMMIFR